MKGVTWLHLSDWHQKGEDFDREVVRDALRKDIQDRTNISQDLAQIDFIVFTGDVAFSGKQLEYRSAVLRFFRPILSASGLGENGAGRLFIVPGNHDIDRDSFKRVPQEWINGLNKREQTNEALEEEYKRKTFLSPFANYAQFISEFLDLKDKNAEPEYCYLRQFEVGGKSIAILGLNSAWLCGRNRDSKGEVYDYGYLVLGEPPIHRHVDQLSKADLRIALVHHPFSWLVEFDRNVVEERLSRACQFVLQGHQHLPRVNVLDSTSGDAITIPAGASYDRRYPTEPRYANSYNLVHLDFETGRGTTYLRRWSDGQSKWLPDSELWKDGRFPFTFSVGPGRSSSEQREALQDLKGKFFRSLRERFCESVSVVIKQILENQNNIDLVRTEMNFRIHVAPGQEGTFRMPTLFSERVNTLLQRGKINIKPFEVIYCKVNGENVEPSVARDEEILYEPRLDEKAATIEYYYKCYVMKEGIYEVRFGRFTKQFKLSFEKEPLLDYEILPLGGFPALKLVQREPLEILEAEIRELCYPHQGYLIYWHSPVSA